MEKKKRGRKPKNQNIIQEKKVPKKRGRKPKNIIDNINAKEHLIFKSNDEDKNNYSDNNLILHLKIFSSDISDIQNVNLSPIPYDVDDNYSLIDNKLNTSIIGMNDYQDNNCFQSKNKNKDVKSEKFLEKYNHCFLKKNIYNTFTSFVYSKDNIWPIQTDIHCLWCVHVFKNIPCGIPTKFLDKKFYLKGCFCSFNCAASYIFDKNEYDKWEQYSLLNLLYSKIYNKIIKIKLAPEREVLKIFGGILNIEEFRQNFNEVNIHYKLNLPPLIAIIPKVEETKINNYNNFVPINENLFNNATINNLDNFDSFMDIKIVNKD
tara:strand:+ start:581 stop:1537 length:957 start_codon:yes stop_codon:yes gene_type:complete